MACASNERCSPVERRWLPYAQQFRSLRAETSVFLIVRVLFLHQARGLAVPVAGLVLVAYLPVSHGQEPFTGAIGGRELARFLQRFDSGRPIFASIMGD